MYPWDRLSKRVYLSAKVALIMPVGPARCLAMLISAMPCCRFSCLRLWLCMC